MKINKNNAFQLWKKHYGDCQFAVDFHGNLMCRDSYGNENDTITYHGKKYKCGWNIHHILPLAHGGTSVKDNLICTNIYTNNAAEDKVTFWIDSYNYQVQRIPNTNRHTIVKLN